MTYLMNGMLLLAEEPSKGPDYGKASPVGLLIVLLLLLGVFLLVRSMNRQLKKVPASFDEGPDPAAPAEASAAATPAAEASAAETPALDPEAVRRDAGD